MNYRTYVRPLFLGFGLFSLVSLGYALLFHNDGKVSDQLKGAATVAIVRPDERSGGTGVIIRSDSTHSEILTNNHVCQVVVNGGIVITDDQRKYAVTTFKRSKFHDLCLITVSADLHINTSLALSAPATYEEAIIAGHPSLLPTVITKGHFSRKIRDDVVMGVRPCTEDDIKGPGALYCLFLGGIPIVKNYEMQVVSATIKPGSSGSAVYNSYGSLAGLVFAGSGDLGYAMIVPYEYVVNFVTLELPTLEAQQPNVVRSLASEPETNNLKNRCNKTNNKKLKDICKTIRKWDL